MDNATGCTIQRELDVCKRGREDSTDIDPDISDGQKADANDKKTPQSGVEDKNPPRAQKGLTIESFHSENEQMVKHNCSFKLSQACEHGRLDVVKDIIFHGLEDINCRDSTGHTPVMFAAMMGRGTVLKYLISKGCDLSLVTNVQKHNVLHKACIYGQVYIVRRLLESGRCDKESKSSFGLTPILLAVQYGYRKLVQLLVRKGCNLKAVDGEKNNILHVACKSGTVDVVMYLVTLRAVKGMETMKNEEGLTPVQIAKRRHHQLLIRLLDPQRAYRDYSHKSSENLSCDNLFN